MFKIIEYKNRDEKNFAYAICSCLLAHEALEIPRPDSNMYIRFNCPKCGRKLGIVIRGKKDERYLPLS